MEFQYRLYQHGRSTGGLGMAPFGPPRPPSFAAWQPASVSSYTGVSSAGTLEKSTNAADKVKYYRPWLECARFERSCPSSSDRTGLSSNTAILYSSSVHAAGVNVERDCPRFKVATRSHALHEPLLPEESLSQCARSTAHRVGTGAYASLPNAAEPSLNGMRYPPSNESAVDSTMIGRITTSPTAIVTQMAQLLMHELLVHILSLQIAATAMTVSMLTPATMKPAASTTAAGFAEISCRGPIYSACGPTRDTHILEWFKERAYSIACRSEPSAEASFSSRMGSVGSGASSS